MLYIYIYIYILYIYTYQLWVLLSENVKLQFIQKDIFSSKINYISVSSKTFLKIYIHFICIYVSVYCYNYLYVFRCRRCCYCCVEIVLHNCTIWSIYKIYLKGDMKNSFHSFHFYSPVCPRHFTWKNYTYLSSENSLSDLVLIKKLIDLLMNLMFLLQIIYQSRIIADMKDLTIWILHIKDIKL